MKKSIDLSSADECSASESLSDSSDFRIFSDNLFEAFRSLAFNFFLPLEDVDDAFEAASDDVADTNLDGRNFEINLILFAQLTNGLSFSLS